MKKFHFPACRGSIELNVITKVHKTQEDFLRGSLHFTLNIIIGTFVGILRTELNLAHCIATASHAVQRVRQTERQMAEVVEAREGEEWLLGYPAPRSAAVFGGRQKQSPPIWGAWRYFCRQQNVILHIARGPQSNPGESTNQDPLSTAYFSRTQTSRKLVSNAWKTRWVLVYLFVCYSILFEVRVQWVESQQSASEGSGGTWSQNHNPQHIALHLGRTELPVVFNSKSPKLRLWLDTETFNCRNRKYQFPTMYLTIF